MCIDKAYCSVCCFENHARVQMSFIEIDVKAKKSLFQGSTVRFYHTQIEEMPMDIADLI